MIKTKGFFMKQRVHFNHFNQENSYLNDWKNDTCKAHKSGCSICSIAH